MSEQQAERAESAEREATSELAEAEAGLDLAELGRRYAAPSGFTEALRDGFRELKRRPADAQRLVALLRGLARKHEPEARRAAEQITRVVESIQRRGER